MLTEYPVFNHRTCFIIQLGTRARHFHCHCLERKKSGDQGFDPFGSLSCDGALSFSPSLSLSLSLSRSFLVSWTAVERYAWNDCLLVVCPTQRAGRFAVLGLLKQLEELDAVFVEHVRATEEANVAS